MTSTSLVRRTSTGPVSHTGLRRSPPPRSEIATRSSSATRPTRTSVRGVAHVDAEPPRRLDRGVPGPGGRDRARLVDVAEGEVLDAEVGRVLDDRTQQPGGFGVPLGCQRCGACGVPGGDRLGQVVERAGRERPLGARPGVLDGRRDVGVVGPGRPRDARHDEQDDQRERDEDRPAGGPAGPLRRRVSQGGRRRRTAWSRDRRRSRRSRGWRRARSSRCRCTCRRG